MRILVTGGSGFIGSTLVKLLLEKNANLTKDRWGNTPLSEVTNKEGEQIEMIRELLSDK